MTLTCGMSPSRFSGKSSGIVRPNSSRRLRALSPYTDEMALLENWYENSFSMLGESVVITCPTKICPGTSVSVVATSGTSVLKKRPPASVVSDRSCV